MHRVLLALPAVFLLNCRGESASNARDDSVVPDSVRLVALAEKLGDWPFLTPIPQLPPLLSAEGGRLGLSADRCGECHPAQYAEWQSSTHAEAVQDLQYLAELAKADSPRWLCLNCHIPVQNQREYLVKPDSRIAERGHDLRGLVEEPNPGFDRKMESESITCAACHVRLDEAGRSVVIGTGRSGASPHPNRADRAGLRATCKRCHEPGRAQLTPTFFCWFETASELAGGPYAGDKDCVDCHMPAVTRPVARGKQPRLTHKHHWSGGGVPKRFDRYATLLERGYEPGLVVGVSLDPVRSGQSLAVRIRYENARAGHALPTADPERHLLIRARIEQGGAVSTDQRLRIGQVWDFGDLQANRPARRLRDNRLGPKEARTWALEVPAPAVLAGAELVVSATHVRLTPDNARHMKQTRGLGDFERYRPGVSELVRDLERHYPFYTTFYEERIPLAGGKRRVTPLSELLQRAGTGGEDLAQLDVLLAGPKE